MAHRGPAESLSTPKETVAGLPEYGWRMKLNYKWTENCTPFRVPKISYFIAMLGFIIRYILYTLYCRIMKKRPHMDFVNPLPYKPIYGCPIGGLGTGTIGRGYRGEFCRFQMVPGMYEYFTVQANAFILTIRKHGNTVYQTVLTGVRTNSMLSSWDWGFPLCRATYHALFPRAWTVYELPEFGITLICRQISPVIPHNYKDSSIPAAAFVWSVENKSTEYVDVSLTFTFKNGNGSENDKEEDVFNEHFNYNSGGRQVTGILIHQTFRSMKCVYAISGAKEPGVHLSHKVKFDPRGNGKELWEDLLQDGKLDTAIGSCVKTKKGEEAAGAVCLQCTIKPGNSETLKFSLAWDMPQVQFRSKEKLYCRRYTRWFGMEGDAGPKLSSYCLQNFKIWEFQIETWQNKILSCKQLPAWYKSALFNELYYISDGGTVWLDQLNSGNGRKGYSEKTLSHLRNFGRFGYLEGHEYRMYNTYDVHFYASFALTMLWPNLQLALQYEYGDAVLKENKQTVIFCMRGVCGPRKVVNTVPHDVGDPEDEPWERINCYNVHPTHEWKDLNQKFILQVFRDYHATLDKNYLRHMYPIMKTLLETSLRWDTDGDGMIENGGFADQTYSSWIAHGVSSYCGSLWLCALRMFVEAAKILGNEEDSTKFTEIMDKARQAFESKLWNGKYYNYDCSKHGYHDSIMSDQLAGNWYLKAAGICDSENPVFPANNVKSALKCIFQNNVMNIGNGNMGAINATRPDGNLDCSNIQAEEFWTGVTYGLAAQMIQEGEKAMAFQTAWGNYNVCWEWFGLMFQTPEAYNMKKQYRSLGYMRAMAIWGMQWALEKYHSDMFHD